MGFGDIFKISQFKQEIARLNTDNSALFADNQRLLKDNTDMHTLLNEIGGFDYAKIKLMISQLDEEYQKKKQQKESEYNIQIEELSSKQQELSNTNISLDNDVTEKRSELERLSKTLKTQINKLNRTKELNKAIQYSLDQYFNYSPEQNDIKLSPSQLEEIESYSPSVILKLHNMDVKDLRKAFRDNNKLIDKVLSEYESRYTTKANKAIYKLMVIALKSELQNILYDLKYEKVDTALDKVKDVTQKYLKIAGEGNQSIVSTLTKFIGEIEYLFTNAVKIEYNYYVKREQAKQEQMAIREQMRQEAAERKALEAERKKIEQEESKYKSEIEKLREQLESAQAETQAALNARILELESQLSTVIVKKEEIATLANGKAGNVYIISNLGSFGSEMFKIGMTRRLEPQDRVNELGDASVPFKFDVHSFIFSDDAVGLENKLHTILNDKRVNKVNRRKEFFYTTIDELEELVTSIEPTAEFNKTMLAEDFRQSQDTDTVFSNDYVFDDEDDE
ncbi:multidrug resistance efflux pump [Aequitasia blattaphilus]|uniref:GIY-YIG nuclease family protein n=1 Tax=Aequitasia blattaphilus TaxID=2949332 RepID=A0ABT1ECT7_9FIRM|nr:GIY-YIG nuclease family protein [Aequitasia blattaphilus]MCP1103635.1 GIY-YIG nuclease family protein [Aequitasia blattaphilus]MCR8616275.1 GIY-YIG nuclease family protein [Aequitasia blattaphilus]